ncbi:peptidoglycan-associated lipoprotein Pal [Ampullimonas aquatilis]|uniref:peptidoglycan-associated lipoprotein Pal n=1 Tax=Ampullimonas aquatilis TaxID=1341549 RepID=UPI003C78E867
MKNVNRSISSKASTLFVALAAGILLSACGSSVKLADKTPVEERGASMPDTSNSRGVAQVQADSKDLGAGPDVSAFAKKSVYFDYDSYIVKDEFRALVEAHAKYLNANKSRKVIVQGNADERGGSEYNLALGQKRAEAVRKSLQLLGVSETQVEAVSLGKEKPRALGHDEAAWSENRRSDFAY